MESSSLQAPNIVHAQLKALQDELDKLTAEVKPTTTSTNEQPETIHGPTLVIRGK